jgi:hypothetical protein
MGDGTYINNLVWTMRHLVIKAVKALRVTGKPLRWLGVNVNGEEI